MCSIDGANHESDSLARGAKWNEKICRRWVSIGITDLYPLLPLFLSSEH